MPEKYFLNKEVFGNYMKIELKSILVKSKHDKIFSTSKYGNTTMFRILQFCFRSPLLLLEREFFRYFNSKMHKL